MNLFQQLVQAAIQRLKIFKDLWKRFTRWMEYNPPYALSMKGWRLFRKEFKENAPIRHFIVDTLPSYWYPVSYKIEKIKDWVRYRTYNRYFMIDTGLEPGYYEINQKMLHGPFNLLKDFVEKEQAWSSQCWSETNRLTRKERLPFYYELFYRKPEIGVAHFEWAATLDDPTLPVHQQSIEQAQAAREVLALYRWWTITRPARETESDITYSDQGFPMSSLDDDFDHTAPDYVAYRKWSDEHEAREEAWTLEDEEMLIRLIKIRHRLWS